ADISGTAPAQARPEASSAPAIASGRAASNAEPAPSVIAVTRTGGSGRTKKEIGVTANGNTVATPSERVNPANFIRIYEDTEGAKRSLIYDPAADEKISVKKLSADKASKLIIVPDPELMSPELSLNNLYMKAILAPRNAELEIEGYSKVGESRAAVQAQRAVA